MIMKKEYDFSGGTRGKFFRPNAKLNLPVYLEPANLKYLENIARKNKADLNTVVNDLIKSDILIANALR
jgi:hypothetical protein